MTTLAASRFLPFISKSLAMLGLVLCLASHSTAANTSSEERLTDKSSEKNAEKNADKLSNEVSAIVNKLDYPELQVIPHASDRLKIEAHEEEYDWFYAHWQIEGSGIATLANALMANSQVRPGLNDSSLSQEASVATLGKVVGIGWVTAGVLIGAGHMYRRGTSNLARFNGKDERSMILRERLAEETLERPARLMGPLIWASVISNVGTNLLLGSYLSDQGRVVAGVSALLGLLPLFYEDHSVSVYKKHLEYKTRIYRPVSSMGLKYEIQNKNYIPVARLAWSF